LPSAPDPPIELHKLQFDYAWKWFSFHADQRVKMFNYMLVVLGIFAAGIVNALDKHLPKAAVSILCFIAAALATIFVLLDIRNRYLVWLGEDVLMDLERRGIFGTDIRISGRYGAEVDLGILSRQALEEQRATDKIRIRLGPDLFVPVVIWIRDALRGKHRVWLPTISCLIAVGFFVAGILILLLTPETAPNRMIFLWPGF
jgi:hypothetical protein